MVPWGLLSANDLVQMAEEGWGRVGVLEAAEIEERNENGVWGLMLQETDVVAGVGAWA